MARFIRWQGIAAFSLIVALMATFVYFFAESLVKSGIEYGGSKAVGAEVNVENVVISYSPLALTIQGMQVTDPEQPEQNMVSFDSAVAGVDIWQYLFGKIIIDELSVDGLAFSSKRAHAGEVYQPQEDDSDPAKATEERLFETPDVSLPDPKSLLADANLKTVQQGKALKESYHHEKKQLKALKATLPNKQTLANYEKQLKALKNVKIKSLADIEKLTADFNKIKAKFKADKAQVAKAKKQLKKSKATLSKQVVALKNAPKEDWQVIESKYQLDKIDGADFAHILFGQQAREYYGYAEMAYEKVQPLLAKDSNAETDDTQIISTGRFVHFVEENPLPEVLIKKAQLAVVSAQGDYVLSLEEVTHQHWVRNLPTTYQVSSSNFINQGNARLAGSFELNTENEATLDGKWRFSNVRLTDVALQEGSKFNLAIDQANMQGEGQFHIKQRLINSNNTIALSKVTFKGDASNQYTAMVVDTFKSLNALDLSVNLTGKVKNPDWQIASPINQQLKGAMSKQLDKKLASFKQDVQRGLNDKVAQQLKLSGQANSEIIELDTLLNDTDKALNNLLNSDIVKQKKKEFQDKAQDKVKDKFNKKLNKLFG